MTKLSRDAALATIEDGELPENVRSASERVAVVLTQSWCPEWFAMQSYLKGMEEPGLTVYYSEYDREPFFHELMRTKEEQFGNRLIPYVRYYVAGSLVGESNGEFSSKRFLSNFA